MNTMKEATVTIKMTKTELTTLNEMITTFPDHKLPVYVVQLRKQLKDIEVRLDEKIHEAVTDRKVSEESIKEQAEVETEQRICTPCED